MLQKQGMFGAPMVNGPSNMDELGALFGIPPGTPPRTGGYTPGINPDAPDIALDGKSLPAPADFAGASGSMGRRRGGMFGGLLRGLGNLARNEDLPLLLFAASSALDGDHASAARIHLAMREARGERQTAVAEAMRRQSQMNNLMKPRDLGGLGMDPGEAERAMMHPESFARSLNERYGAFNVGEGDSLVFGGPGGQNQTWRAPKTYEQGADIINFDPNTGLQNRFVGMTPAEQNARALGLQPGTPDFDTYVRDFTLNGQGPTGTETTRRGQDISAETARRGQDVSASTTQRGQDISSNTARRAQDIGSANTRRGQNMQGSRPTGRTAINPQTRERMMELSNGTWVPMN